MCRKSVRVRRSSCGRISQRSSRGSLSRAPRYIRKTYLLDSCMASYICYESQYRAAAYYVGSRSQQSFLNTYIGLRTSLNILYQLQSEPHGYISYGHLHAYKLQMYLSQCIYLPKNACRPADAETSGENVKVGGARGVCAIPGPAHGGREMVAAWTEAVGLLRATSGDGGSLLRLSGALRLRELQAADL
jgi:hypothetical protein